MDLSAPQPDCLLTNLHSFILLHMENSNKLTKQTALETKTHTKNKIDSEQELCSVQTMHV